MPSCMEPSRMLRKSSNAMWLAMQNRSLLIVVRDPGDGFDPAKIPSPVVGENLFSGHGRGVYLITQLMDEVKFLKNGTEIHMIKR